MSDEQAPKPQTRYGRYVEEISEDIAEIVQQFGCQPILFVGSGLAKRYINAPSWDELLGHLASECTAIQKGLGFYKQSLHTPLKIGEEFAKFYQEWAWGVGHNEFPEELFNEDVGAQSYIKYKISKHLSSITPTDVLALLAGAHASEIEILQQIRPHAIITTNYDRLLEMLFPHHEPIIGQQILKGQQFAVGEIYKIHGCVTDFNSIVFTQTDYDEFAKKKKFLSAKLLTFFNEHPLIFIGYSASDPNIRSILSDIDQALPEKGGVIPNVYILEWNPSITEDSYPALEKVISTEDDRSVRVKLIEANNLSWVFKAFAANPSLNNVNPRVLRALIARSYNLIRHDIPSMSVHADFQMLTSSVENAEEFGKLFGLANVDNYSLASAQHPFSATQVGKLLGGERWHTANRLIDKLTQISGINIKSSDNRSTERRWLTHHRFINILRTP